MRRILILQRPISKSNLIKFSIIIDKFISIMVWSKLLYWFIWYSPIFRYIKFLNYLKRVGFVRVCFPIYISDQRTKDLNCAHIISFWNFAYIFSHCKLFLFISDCDGTNRTGIRSIWEWGICVHFRDFRV